MGKLLFAGGDGCRTNVTTVKAAMEKNSEARRAGLA
jgi:hypothetical protein